MFATGFRNSEVLRNIFLNYLKGSLYWTLPGESQNNQSSWFNHKLSYLHFPPLEAAGKNN